MANLNINAQNALAELRALIAQVNKLKTELNAIKGTNSKSFVDLEKSTKKLKDQIALLGNKMNLMQAVIKKQNAQMNKATKSTNQNTSATKKNTQAKNKSLSANKTLTTSYSGLISAFGVIGGLSIFANILSDTYDQIKTFDSLNFALQRITQSTEDYQSSQNFLLTITRDFGTELVTTTNRWIKFLAASKNAGLSLRDTENIFRSMTKAAGVLGLKTDELQGIYLALEQMLSKGKVSTEELRRQLGERLPGAMGIMAASIGVTIPELDKMLRRGEVLSAEVLPKFADAVEVAFGIETVSKIDTLVAAENRAVAAWQNLVRSISGSDSVINKAFTSILNGLAKFTNMTTFVIGGEDNRLQERIMGQEKSVLRVLKLFGQNGFDMHKRFKESKLYLDEKIAEAQSKLRKTANKEERKDLKDQLDDLQRQLVNYNQEIKENMKESAIKLFPNAEQDYQVAKENLRILREVEKEAQKIISPGGASRGGDRKKSFIDSEVLAKTGLDLKTLKQQFVEASATYNVYKKFIDESDVQTLPDDGNGSKRARRREQILKKVMTLEKEAQREIAKSSIETNKSLIKSDQVTFDERILIERQNLKLSDRIADLNREIEIEKAQDHLDRKNAQLEKMLKDGVKIVGDVEKQKADLQTQFDNKVIIADEKREKAKEVNMQQSSDKILAIIENINKARIAGVEDPYNIEISAIKKSYELSKKTAEDRIKLETELKRVAIESANAQIDAQIQLLRAQLEVKNQSEDTINAIIRKIHQLQAAKKTLIAPTSEGDEYNLWELILNLADQYNQAIGDLVDAAYNRRIENINAEIDAETRKYDKLIQLAEGDDEQQKTLERNKQERIRALELKRLKEEQKQARARKAFAVVDIGISTAQAIMRAYADTGPIGGAVLASIVGALGAVQIAAVLAQPIPQYKDGGEISENQLAMINDGGVQEYVERNGKILASGTKNALVDLKAGDVVYKDYDDMINNSLLIPNGINEVGSGFSERDFSAFFGGMQSSIEKGFKKAKIVNNISLNNNNNDSYREELSRW